MKRELKTISLLLVIALILGAFLLLSEPAEAEGTYIERTIEPIEVTHEEAMSFVEEGEGPIVPLNVGERDLVERVVAAEARGESIECMMGVAQAIRDRSVLRGETVTEVCTAEYQFAAPFYGEISSRVRDAVFFTFDKGHNALEYPTTHFYATKLIDPPYWTEGKVCRGIIDDVAFYY